MINTVDVPRGGWNYAVAATGALVNAGSVNRLKHLVRAHMVANQVPVPHDLDETVEDCACRNLPRWTNWCTDAPPPPVNGYPKSRWKVDTVLRFVKTMAAWGAKSGFAFVDHAEAERRAAICSTCPLNVAVNGCAGCAGVTKLVTSLRSGRETTHDQSLEVCDACGCELKVKVLIPLEAINSTGVEYPAHCWQSPLKPFEQPLSEPGSGREGNDSVGHDADAGEDHSADNVAEM